VRSEDSETFSGTHILGASRGLLCDSYAVLLYHLVNVIYISISIYVFAGNWTYITEEHMTVDTQRFLGSRAFSLHFPVIVWKFFN